jgi:hypothetical protein
MSIRTTGNERDESGSCLCRPTGVCLSNTYSNHHLILDVKECMSVSVSVCVHVCVQLPLTCIQGTVLITLIAS